MCSTEIFTHLFNLCRYKYFRFTCWYTTKWYCIMRIFFRWFIPLNWEGVPRYAILYHNGSCMKRNTTKDNMRRCGPQSPCVTGNEIQYSTSLKHLVRCSLNNGMGYQCEALILISPGKRTVKVCSHENTIWNFKIARSSKHLLLYSATYDANKSHLRVLFSEIDRPREATWAEEIGHWSHFVRPWKHAAPPTHFLAASSIINSFLPICS